VSAPAVTVKAGRHDAAARRRATRAGRQRGCSIYITAEDLVAAGFDPHAAPPEYVTTAKPHSRNTATVIVRLYR
jgi:hypothetical protein